MARKKKSKGKTSKRRHSRVGKIDFMKPLGMVAGAIAGNYVKKMLSPMLTFGGKDYSGAAVLVAGVWGESMVKDPLMKGVCDGLIVSGGVSTIHTFIPSLPINGVDQIGYFPSPNTILGLPRPRMVNGVDEIGAYSEMPWMDSDNKYAY